MSSTNTIIVGVIAESPYAEYMVYYNKKQLKKLFLFI